MDPATRQRINSKLHQALDAARARRLSASAPPPDPLTQAGSFAEALQSQLVKATTELRERTQELSYWHARVECGDTAQNQAATLLIRPSVVFGALVQWLSTPEARGLPAVRSGLGLLASVMQTQEGASPLVWVHGAGGIAAVGRVMARVLAVCTTLTDEPDEPDAADAAEELLLGFGQNLCRWSLAADAAGTAPAYLLATQRLLEQLGGGRSVLSAPSSGAPQPHHPCEPLGQPRLPLWEALRTLKVQACRSEPHERHGHHIASAANCGL